MNRFFLRNQKNKSGQAILVVVLITVVALTIGLSIAARTSTDIKISQQTEQYQRAFSAAEAGIENTLLSGIGGNNISVGNASYSVNVRETSQNEFVFWNITKDDNFQFWLADHNNMGTEVYTNDKIRVVWGNQDALWASHSYTPAIEIIIVYSDNGVYKLGKYVLDPQTDRSNNFCKSNGDNCPTGIDHFTTTGETVGGTKFQFGADIPLGDFRNGTTKILQITRGRLLYNTSGQPVGFKSLGPNFPSQGKIIDAVGIADKSTAKVQVFSGYESLPQIFDFVLFSNQALEKN